MSVERRLVKPPSQMHEQLNRREALAAVTRHATTYTLPKVATRVLAADIAAAAAFDSRDEAVAALLAHAAQGLVAGHG